MRALFFSAFSRFAYNLPLHLHDLTLIFVGMFALTGCGGGSSSSATSSGNSTPIKVTISSTLAANESFEFGLSSQNVAITQSGVAVGFSANLANGVTYSVNQLSGPRSCTLSANRSGTTNGATINIIADCGTPPGMSALTGTLYGPINSQVALQYNSSNDLTVTIPPFSGSTDSYNSLPFSFPSLLTDGTAYQLSIKTAPTGQKCSVYSGATGIMPVAVGGVKVGCEYIYDLLSRSSDNTKFGTYFESSAPVVGGARVAVGTTPDAYGEGRFVAFVSNAIGLGSATGAKRQVFWRDRLTGETVLISATAAGLEGNGDSFAPAISADGLKVAFESYASNLVANDTNAVRDVFIWSAMSRQNGVQRVSVGSGGSEANAESYEPSLSGDGTIVAFSSGASNLSAGVSGTNTINVYRRDLSTGINTLVSSNPAGTGVGGSKPALSEDGNRLAFYSFAATLVGGDSNGMWDIFVYDHTLATLARVSLTATGGERNQGSESISRVVAPAISGDGRYVAFATTSTNMTSSDTNNAQDVFIVDTQTGSVNRASVNSLGIQGNADSPVGQGERVSLTYDGTWVAFSTKSTNFGTGSDNIVMHNRVTGETRAVSAQIGSSVGGASISRNGAYVVFGAGNQLDSRFSSSGLFARFTGLDRAWWWLD
jgi:hypothetical protein